MLAEFLEELRRLSVAAEDATIHRVAELPSRIAIDCGGKVEFHEVEPKPRHHRMHDLPSLCAAIKDKTVCPDPEVYLNAAGVVVLCDRAKRHETVALRLMLSTRFQTLSALQAGKRCTPKEAVRLLRYDLHGCGIETVLGGLRRLDFQRSSTGKAHHEHGKDSLGRSVEMKVQNAEGIPEDFVVAVRVFAAPGPDFVAQVGVGLEIDFENQGVILRTLPDEIEAATSAATRSVQDVIVTECVDVPVFIGEAHGAG